MRIYNHVNWEVVSTFAGKVPDARVAALAGCTYMTVLRYRQQKGIPPLKKRGVAWAKYKALEAEDAPIDVVAKLMGCPPTLIALVRGKAKAVKPPEDPPPERFNYNGVLQAFWADVGAETYAEKVYAWSIVLRIFREEEELQKG